jgi:signal transduction histidine kinase
MITLAIFFEKNHETIFFIYGLVFFVLGLSIILQVRRSSNLDLARSLRWMAAFGFTHAFNEWGDIFIPIQASYLDAPAIRVLYTIQLILLAFSFFCLFEFGVSVIVSLGQFPWLKYFAIISFSIWFITTMVIMLQVSNDHHQWLQISNALARYLIGFPGGMLAAYGLRIYTLKRIKPLKVPEIVHMFQFAGFSLAIYSILTGLIPSPTSFFPGNWLNSITFSKLVGIPPWVFRSLVSMVITIALIRAMEIFDLEAERRIEELEQQQIIIDERDRLARDLHDGALQKAYTAGLLVESACRLAEPDSIIKNRLQKAVSVLNDSITDYRRNLAELYASDQNSPESITDLLQQITTDESYTSMVNLSLTKDLKNNFKLSSRYTRHVFAIINEAMTNTIRHAQAKNVNIIVTDLGDNLEIVIKDDGIGFSEIQKTGYGLCNMRDRARLLNGIIEINNDHGTTITLTIPWVD